MATKRPSYLKRLKEQKRSARAIEKSEALERKLAKAGEDPREQAIEEFRESAIPEGGTGQGFKLGLQIPPFGC